MARARGSAQSADPLRAVVGGRRRGARDPGGRVHRLLRAPGQRRRAGACRAGEGRPRRLRAAPAPAPARGPTLKQLLAPEEAARRSERRRSRADARVVTLLARDLFASGSATVNPAYDDDAAAARGRAEPGAGPRAGRRAHRRSAGPLAALSGQLRALARAGGQRRARCCSAALDNPARVEWTGVGSSAAALSPRIRPGEPRAQPARRDHPRARDLRCESPGCDRLTSSRWTHVSFFKRRAFLVVLGFVLLALFIWFAGPYFAFADYRPLESATRAADRDRARRRRLGRRRMLLKRLRANRASDKLVAAVVAAVAAEPQASRRRRAAARAVRRSGRHAQAEAAQRPQPLRPALVRHHRRARVGQDDGAASTRAEVPARAARRQGRAARRRRHAQLRLVVHRRSGVPRHRRPLHDAGFRRGLRQRGLGRVPRAAAQVPQAPAGQRRHPDHQRAGPDGAGRRASARRTSKPRAGGSTSSIASCASSCRST